MISTTKLALPMRKVVGEKPAHPRLAVLGVALSLTLECGHRVDLLKGFPVPQEVACKECLLQGQSKPSKE